MYKRQELSQDTVVKAVAGIMVDLRVVQVLVCIVITMLTPDFPELMVEMQ